MQKHTKTSAKILSVLLVMLMMLTSIPLSFTASAATKEYYYPAGTQFVKDIVMCYYKDQNEAKNAITARGYLLDRDLTQGTGGDYYVYMGWTWTTNPAEAVTGVRIMHNNGTPSSFSQSGVMWYPVNSNAHSWVPQLHGDGCVDTNRGAGGDDIFVYITKDPSFGPPVTNIWVTGSTTERDQYNSAGWTPTVSFQDNGYQIDLNKGAGGADLFMHYYNRVCTTVNTSSLRTAINNAAQYTSSANYTQASKTALSNAVTAGTTITNGIDAYGTNVGFTTYTQAQINTATTNINNAINNLKTTLTLNGSKNGGTDQTIELTVGTKSSVSVNLGNYTSTKAGFDFIGWDKNSTALGGTTGTVEVGFNETYYAIFGKQLSATFHYLTEDGQLTSQKKTVQILNAATQGSVPAPVVKDATYDNRTFTLEGWRYDTQLTTAEKGKTDIFTITLDNPNINVYAVYSAPISLNYSTHKDASTIESQTQTQYLNISEEINKTTHTFTVTDEIPTVYGGEFLGWAENEGAIAGEFNGGKQLTITSDKTIYSVFKMLNYQVKFYDAQGNVIDTQTVDYGNDAVAPSEVPSKQYDEEYHYEFANWDDYTKVYADKDILPNFTAIHHEYVISEVTAPTCTETGLDHYACACGYEKDIVINMLPHDIIVVPGVVATCTSNGVTDRISCSSCGNVLQEAEKIPMIGHNYVCDPNLTVSPTCSTGGYEVWVCTNNEDHTLTKNHIAPTGTHKEETLKAEAATCTKDGYTEYTRCKHCKAIIVPAVLITATGHDYEIIEAEKPATCTEAGKTATEKCKVCENVKEGKEISALDHNWIIVNEVPSTCVTQGTSAGKACYRCNLVEGVEKLELAAHTYVAFEAKAATCTQDGYTAGQKCTVCELVIESEVIEAFGHNYEGTVTDPTCTASGYTTYICKNDPTHKEIGNYVPAIKHYGGTATCIELATCDGCGNKYGKKGDHSYESKVTAPTCTVKGYTTYTCKFCNDTYTADETAVIAHTFGEGVVTTPPSCTAEGVMTYTCTECPASYTETIATIAHNVESWELVNSKAEGTCTECGEQILAEPEDVGIEYNGCERCGMKHKYNSGIFKYKGIYCNIVAFFREILAMLKGI